MLHRYKKLALKRGYRPGHPSRPELSQHIIRLARQHMSLNCRTTAVQLQDILARHGVNLPLKTILKNRSRLRWQFHGAAFNRSMGRTSKKKRLDWARENLNGCSRNIIWSGATSIQLEGLSTERRRVQPLHLWGAISEKGATKICISRDRVDNTQQYVEILRCYLVPYIHDHMAKSHKFMQNNDPKHTSHVACSFLQANNIRWSRTPPNSPDVSAMENVWYDMKEYIRDKVRPSSQRELIAGVQEFWKTMTPAKCNRYLGYQYELLSRIIELEGASTGF